MSNRDKHGRFKRSELSTASAMRREAELALLERLRAELAKPEMYPHEL